MIFVQIEIFNWLGNLKKKKTIYVIRQQLIIEIIDGTKNHKKRAR